MFLLFIPRAANAQCHAAFHDSTSSPLNMGWANTSTGGRAAYTFWSFGDGSSVYSGDHYVAHHYAHGGVYTVCLYVNDSTGHVCDSVCGVYTILDSCHASATATGGDCGSNIVFTNTSSGYSIIHINFGDGHTSAFTGPTVSHHYSPGTYTAMFYGTGGSFCGTGLDTSYVTVIANHGLSMPNFSYTIIGDSIWLEHIGSMYDSAYGHPIAASWNVDHVTHATLDYHYGVHLSPGTHTICLKDILYGSPYCVSDSICQTITIGGTPCHAAFTYTMTGTTATFASAATGGYAPYTLWEFGDGHSYTGDLRTVTHTYGGPGRYTACLYVRDSLGYVCDSTCMAVLVTAAGSGCHALFEDSITGTLVGTFYSGASGGNPSYTLWTFGDGTSYTGDLRTITHTFPHTGSYTVCQYIRDSSGHNCDSVCHSIAFTSGGSGCHAVFTETVSCMTVHFVASTGPASFYWSFGDGHTASGRDPVHTYSDTGASPHVFFVTLYALDSSGHVCDSTTQAITLASYHYISGHVWNDNNGNGLIDHSETYRSGVRVNLYMAGTGTLLQHTSTNISGSYAFSVTPGAYRIELQADSLGGALFQTYPSSPSYYDDTVTTACSYSDRYRFGVNDTTVSMRVSGTVYYDANSNGVRDGGETGVASQQVLVGAYSCWTNAHGEYSITVPFASYLISYIIPATLPGYINTSPAAINLVPTAGSYVYTGRNFGINDTTPITDLCAELIPEWGLNSYTPTWYSVHVNNNGTLNTDGNVVMHYDPAFNYTGSYPTGVHDAVAHTITWTFTALSPHSYAGFLATFDPVTGVPLGTHVHNSVTTTSTTGSETELRCNTDSLTQEVGVSYDPNDKQVSPVGETAEGIIDNNQEMTYTIRFQNTGTASAVDIVVVDTISPNLDLQSFHVTASSHAMHTQINGRAIMFFMDHIMLPDSLSDPTGSMGYIKYKINQVPFLAPHTTIQNFADIYFDANPAVRTNTTLNTLRYQSSIQRVNADVSLKTYPNPFENEVNFDVKGLNNGAATLKVYDSKGALVIEKSFTGNKEGNVLNVNTASLTGDMYFFEITQNNMSIAQGKLVRH